MPTHGQDRKGTALYRIIGRDRAGAIAYLAYADDYTAHYYGLTRWCESAEIAVKAHDSEDYRYQMAEWSHDAGHTFYYHTATALYETLRAYTAELDAQEAAAQEPEAVEGDSTPADPQEWPCPYCDGSGSGEGFLTVCGRCNGSGTIDTPPPPWVNPYPQPEHLGRYPDDAPADPESAGPRPIGRMEEAKAWIDADVPF